MERERERGEQDEKGKPKGGSCRATELFIFYFIFFVRGKAIPNPMSLFTAFCGIIV